MTGKSLGPNAYEFPQQPNLGGLSEKILLKQRMSIDFPQPIRNRVGRLFQPVAIDRQDREFVLTQLPLEIGFQRVARDSFELQAEK